LNRSHNYYFSQKYEIIISICNLAGFFLLAANVAYTNVVINIRRCQIYNMRKNCHIEVVYENSSNPDAVAEMRIIHQYQGSAANITIIQITKE